MTRYAPRWFEDFEVGETFETAGLTLHESSITDFALTWDPQPFHIDKTYADASIYGGLIASGFQTLLVGFRLAHQAGMFGHNRGGSGLDYVNWPRAVKPGDTLRARLEVKALEERRTSGRVKVDMVILNQDDEPVLETALNYFIAKRPT